MTKNKRHCMQAAFRAWLLTIAGALSILALAATPTGSAGRVLGAAPDQAPPAGLDFAAVDAYIELFMADNRVPGVALAIVSGDQIVHLRGFGVANPAGAPVTAQTPFVLGSTSKSFTALSVMQLVEVGQIELDKPVRHYLPWFEVGQEGAAGEVTVRHLLNHTSGIPQLAGEASLGGNDTRADALEQQVRGLSRWTLRFPPGSAYEYSNANYQTAGLIVQTVAGESFESYVRGHLFDPLDMERSFTNKAEAQAHGLAEGYHYWLGIPLAVGGTPFPRQHVPSGYFVSTAQDLAHALIAHLNAGQYRGRSLISPAGLAVLQRPVRANYAMGWAVNGQQLSHNGSVADFGSQFMIDRQRRLGLAVLFNINNAVGAGHLYVLAPNVLNILTGQTLVPTPPETQYFALAILLVGLVMGALAWFAWSVARVRRWRYGPAGRPSGARAGLWLVGPLVIEITLVVYLLSLLKPGLITAWQYQPDLTLLILVSVGLLAGWGGVRTVCGMRLMFGRASVTHTVSAVLEGEGGPVPTPRASGQGTDRPGTNSLR